MPGQPSTSLLVNVEAFDVHPDGRCVLTARWMLPAYLGIFSAVVVPVVAILGKLLRTGLAELSMGMSTDFDIAVEEGANWIRVGTLLFGARTQK